MARHEWTLNIPNGSTYRVMAWADRPPGKVFQESTHSPAGGVRPSVSSTTNMVIFALRADSRNGRAAFEIYADIAGISPHNVHSLTEDAWDVIRGAFENGKYILVPRRATGITYEQLHEIMPKLEESKARRYLPFLNDAMDDANVTTPLRQAAFLAQLAEESNQLRQFMEGASGDEYEGRTDLGNVNPGDGRRYKGRGPIQITGRNNYRALGAALGVDVVTNPDLVATPEIGFRAAAWFWTSRRHNLNAYADVRNFDAITVGVNGGTNGKDVRDAFYAVAKRVLGCQ